MAQANRATFGAMADKSSMALRQARFHSPMAVASVGVAHALRGRALPTVRGTRA
jgi:hypothetical protein